MSEHPNKSREAETRAGWFDYLLDKLEVAIERDAVQWDAATANAAQERTRRGPIILLPRYAR
jgi:hypothetical protein